MQAKYWRQNWGRETWEQFNGWKFPLGFFGGYCLGEIYLLYSLVLSLSFNIVLTLALFGMRLYALTFEVSIRLITSNTVNNMTTIKTLNEKGSQYFAGVNQRGIIRWTSFRHLANTFKLEKSAMKAATELQNDYKVITKLSVVKDA